jgi:dipeptidyl aminopeptidase/acylaminoacyl peptidase
LWASRPSPSSQAPWRRPANRPFRVEADGFCSTDPLDENVEIYASADGSSIQNLSNNPNGDHDPRWSPDGTTVAFVRKFADGNIDVFVMNADGSGQTRLTNGPAGDELRSWTADGRHLVFSSNRDGDYDLLVIDAADGSSLTRTEMAWLASTSRLPPSEVTWSLSATAMELSICTRPRPRAARCSA